MLDPLQKSACRALPIIIFDIVGGILQRGVHASQSGIVITRIGHEQAALAATHHIQIARQ